MKLKYLIIIVLAARFLRRNIIIKDYCQLCSQESAEMLVGELLVMRQKGEPQNRCFKKIKPNFPKNKHFLSPDTQTRCYKALHRRYNRGYCLRLFL